MADNFSTTINTFPPDDASRKALTEVPGTRLTQGVVSALDGPTAAGPEQARALTVVYSAFTDDAGAQRGYRAFAAIKEEFRTLPGFLRWLTFADGPHGYALGFWRSAEDVDRFVTGAGHQAMVREQRERPFEYTQFAGVWTAHRLGRRNLYCPRCTTVTPAPATCCRGCAGVLSDPFGVRPT